MEADSKTGDRENDKGINDTGIDELKCAIEYSNSYRWKGWHEVFLHDYVSEYMRGIKGGHNPIHSGYSIMCVRWFALCFSLCEDGVLSLQGIIDAVLLVILFFVCVFVFGIYYMVDVANIRKVWETIKDEEMA